MFAKNSEKLFDIINNVFMFIIIFICLYPLWYVLCLSLNNDNLVASRDVWFLPGAFFLGAYQDVFRNDSLITSFIVSVERTLLGAGAGVFLNAFMAYGISRKYLVGRKFIMVFVLITMYFYGGLIPWYLTLKNLHLTGSFFGLVVPALYGGFNIIIMKAFYETIPESMEESAKLEGANDIIVFFKIMLPFSAPVMATIALFLAVFHWNDWFWGELLISKTSGIPLQTLLMRIIFQSQASLLVLHGGPGGVSKPSSDSVKMASIIVSTVPILCVYPFLQKYFVKGIMLGAVKG